MSVVAVPVLSPSSLQPIFLLLPNRLQQLVYIPHSIYLIIYSRRMKVSNELLAHVVNQIFSRHANNKEDTLYISELHEFFSETLAVTAKITLAQIRDSLVKVNASTTDRITKHEMITVLTSLVSRRKLLKRENSQKEQEFLDMERRRDRASRERSRSKPKGGSSDRAKSPLQKIANNLNRGSRTPMVKIPKSPQNKGVQIFIR